MKIFKMVYVGLMASGVTVSTLWATSARDASAGIEGPYADYVRLEKAQNYPKILLPDLTLLECYSLDNVAEEYGWVCESNWGSCECYQMFVLDVEAELKHGISIPTAK